MIDITPTTAACPDSNDAVEALPCMNNDLAGSIEGCEEISVDLNEDDKSVASVLTSGSISYCGRSYSTDEFSNGNQVLVETMGNQEGINNEKHTSEDSLGRMLEGITKFLSGGNHDAPSVSPIGRRSNLTRSMSAKAAIRVPPRPPRQSLRPGVRRSQSFNARYPRPRNTEKRCYMARTWSDNSVWYAPESSMHNLRTSLFGNSFKEHVNVPQHLLHAFSAMAVDDDDINCFVNDDHEFHRFQLALQRNGAITNGKMQQVLPLYVGKRRDKIHKKAPSA